MSSTQSLLAIVQHTPPWVWALLAALLALGLAQARARRVGPTRAALLPAAMLAWSLWGVATSFGSAPALPAWAAGASAAALATRRLGAPAGTRWSAQAHAFQLPGSWLPLALILALFCCKFATGALLALRPALGADPAFATGASLAFGAFSGVFAGRALALLRLAPPRASLWPAWAAERQNQRP